MSDLVGNQNIGFLMTRLIHLLRIVSQAVGDAVISEKQGIQDIKHLNIRTSNNFAVDILKLGVMS